MFIRGRPGLLMAMAALLGAGAVTPAWGSGSSRDTPDSLPPPDPTTSGAAVERDYHVGPLDQLDVSVFQVDQLKTTVMVNSLGQISLPLVGTMDAGGKTTAQLETEIAQKMSEYVVSPQVSVFVRQAQSQKVTIEGAVSAPGLYPLTGRTTLLQAIAMAHGFNQFGKLDQVVVFRTVSGKRMAARFDIASIRAGKYEDPEIFGNDFIEVGESASKRRLYDIEQALPIVSVFRFWP